MLLPGPVHPKCRHSNAVRRCNSLTLQRLPVLILHRPHRAEGSRWAAAGAASSISSHSTWVALLSVPTRPWQCAAVARASNSETPRRWCGAYHPRKYPLSPREAAAGRRGEGSVAREEAAGPSRGGGAPERKEGQDGGPLTMGRTRKTPPTRSRALNQETTRGHPAIHQALHSSLTLQEFPVIIQRVLNQKNKGPGLMRSRYAGTGAS